MKKNTGSAFLILVMIVALLAAATFSISETHLLQNSRARGTAENALDDYLVMQNVSVLLKSEYDTAKQDWTSCSNKYVVPGSGIKLCLASSQCVKNPESEEAICSFPISQLLPKNFIHSRRELAQEVQVKIAPYDAHILASQAQQYPSWSQFWAKATHQDSVGLFESTAYASRMTLPTIIGSPSNNIQVPGCPGSGQCMACNPNPSPPNNLACLTVSLCLSPLGTCGAGETVAETFGFGNY